MNYKRRLVMSAASSTLLLLGQAQAAEDEPLEQVVVTGTRVANRSALGNGRAGRRRLGDQLQNLGVTEINQALAASLPSFNFPRPGPDRRYRCGASRRRCAASRPIRHWCSSTASAGTPPHWST